MKKNTQNSGCNILKINYDEKIRHYYEPVRIVTVSVTIIPLSVMFRIISFAANLQIDLSWLTLSLTWSYQLISSRFIATPLQ